LLVALAPERAVEMDAALASEGLPPAAAIGRVIAGPAGSIVAR
jgi:hypothetical protein